MHNFWDGLNDNQINFFGRIFDGLSPEPVRIVGTFPMSPPVVSGFDRERFHWVAYSGEAYSYPKGMWDLNLIMEQTDHSSQTVCLPLFSVYSYLGNHWEKLSRRRAPLAKDKFCAMVVSNPVGKERNKWFKMLSRYDRVDSWGKWMNNMNKPLPQVAWDGLFSQYKFSLCFENTIKPFYLTEKLLHSYLSGVIPIYAGAAAAQEWLNPKAFIHIQDFSFLGQRQALSTIKKLAENEDAYMEMFCEPLLKHDFIPYQMSIEFFRENIEALL